MCVHAGLSVGPREPPALFTLGAARNYFGRTGSEGERSEVQPGNERKTLRRATPRGEIYREGRECEGERGGRSRREIGRAGTRSAPSGTSRTRTPRSTSKRTGGRERLDRSAGDKDRKGNREADERAPGGKTEAVQDAGRDSSKLRDLVHEIRERLGTALTISRWDAFFLQTEIKWSRLIGFEEFRVDDLLGLLTWLLIQLMILTLIILIFMCIKFLFNGVE